MPVDLRSTEFQGLGEMTDLYDEFWADDAYGTSWKNPNVFAEWVDTADDRGAP